MLNLMPDRSTLYDLADALYRLAPWRWLSETQIIGLRHPDTGELGWMSMMGAAGNHMSLAVYLGDEPVSRFNLIQNASGEGGDVSGDDALRLILEARQLQVSFALRDELFKEELAEIKSLGRKYRGGNWPCFRSFHAGWAPDHRVTEEETVWLVCALENFAAVAPRLRDDPFANLRSGPGGMLVLTRELVNGQWQDAWTPEDTRLYQWPEPQPEAFMIEKVRRNPSALEIECALRLLPSPIGPAGNPAVFPYLLLCVDKASGFVLGVEVLSVEGRSFEELIGFVPGGVLRFCDRHQVRPACIRVPDASSAALLAGTAKALGVKLHRPDHLPALEEAIDGVMGFMRGRMN